ncbi:MAG TPA: branched-chain amino acid ABC transporter permease, partial [Chloroflexota bacterium]|nr:branched-chain amino acid ABC transporter permease [Chloroflexota bacterium]
PRARSIALSAVAVVVAVAFAYLSNAFLLRLGTLVLMYAALGQAWNFIGGYTGYPAFGNTVFFGIGAYATAVVMLHGGPFVAGLAAATLAASACAVLLGLVVLRLQGHYFAIVTLGIGEVARELVTNSDALGAATGLVLPIANDLKLFYLLMLACVIGIAATTYAMERARLGYALIAIRENEGAAGSLGIDTQRYKITAFALSAAFSGVVGGVYSYWATFIDPSIVFTPAISVQAILVALLGGPGTVVGPILGSLVLESAANLIWGNLLSWHDAFLGAMIVVAVMLLPRGMTGLYPFHRVSLASAWDYVRGNAV